MYPQILRRTHNWQYKAEFEDNYIEMIKSFRNLASAPSVWICYPVPAYPGRWGISDKTIKNEVMPLIEKAAAKTDVKIIDLYTALSNKAELFRDKIHPNAEGAGIMAKTIAAVITGKSLPAKVVPRMSGKEQGK